MAWTTPRTWIPGETPDATLLNQHIRDNLLAILPVGTLIYRVAPATAVETVVENRFLECNGVAVSRTTYATLFNYLNGLTPALPFGTGNGSTTFNIPDFRGRLPVSAAGAGGKAQVDIVGDNDGLTQAQRNINHRHGISNVGDAGAQGNLGQNNTLDQGNYITDGDTDNVNQPAYLVGGVWFIKYTS
jgi:microcystin-dependent protein